ncbi:TniQ family protein [Thiomicrospira sp. WB1]|uniref:TniQ family protein n=1 Tax=Thiomicrospira sp. WB1 TaxID=1685380 RepID=UPI000745F56F|nr:TniQ family protein [Thiomicrospira sp. WB1]KUJ71539.1 hypothetical protein AVO41_08465 [Thiomicrospira sp. WB1]
MLSGKLWPVHPHPYPNELMSSWLVRIAHANGEKVQTFCHQEFGVKHQVWNRDIDRLGPDWLLSQLAEKTATAIKVVRQTTLKRYEGVLFQHARNSGVEPWITPLKVYHRKHNGFGMQFCPQCLKEDEEPYFRTHWRVALYTFCPKHQIMMHDRCQECGEPVAFHRIELGKGNEEVGLEKKLATCFNCGFYLAASKREKADHLTWNVFENWQDTLLGLEGVSLTEYDIERLVVLHQFSKLLTSKATSEKLLKFIEETMSLSLNRPNLELKSFDKNDLSIRHQTIGCGWWLLMDWPNNLYWTWLNGAVRYNQLLKDLWFIPSWYSAEVTFFNVNYRKRLDLLEKGNKTHSIHLPE